MSVPRIEPCGTPYFNVSDSEQKYYQCKPNILCLKDRAQTI